MAVFGVLPAPLARSLCTHTFEGPGSAPESGESSRSAVWSTDHPVNDPQDEPERKDHKPERSKKPANRTCYDLAHVPTGRNLWSVSNSFTLRFLIFLDLLSQAIE